MSSNPEEGLRRKTHRIIFGADTPAGKLFDVILIATILLSVATVMLDSVDSIHRRYGDQLLWAEWGFTILFTLEYIIRLYIVGRPLGYAYSFFGIVDLLAILPSYISLMLPETQYLLVIRVLRLLRVFRVLKLVQYSQESQILIKALQASRRKIIVFVFGVLTVVTIVGSVMYLVEGSENGFTSIPRGVYWAIVTLTTVGYGDISPQTPLGQTLASFIMILGYGIIAIPTGIVTAEMTNFRLTASNTRCCPECTAEGHDNDANFCKFCGSDL